ncbi:hypothetical protein [Streptomyces sp. NPDC093097]|uniref:hypothetical protein n=1 Tax=Streptomyces sp. NPDC093097 TaxID=3366027 RepID=UPI0038290CCD
MGEIWMQAGECRYLWRYFTGMQYPRGGHVPPCPQSLEGADHATRNDRIRQHGHGRDDGSIPARLATAVQGTLYINGQRYNNPRGCYNSQRLPMSVKNQTTYRVLIYGRANCQGSSIATLEPGREATYEFGESVFAY